MGRQGASADGRESTADKFTNLYKDALLRKERQDKIYNNCIGPEFTFKPDTTKSKYYYQRLLTSDPDYQQHQQQLKTLTQSYNSEQNRGNQGNAQLRVGPNHYRTSSEGRLNEKERLHRSLKKSATLSNDLFDPDSGF